MLFSTNRDGEEKMAQPILFDVVMWSGAVTSCVAAALVWNGWRLYRCAEIKTQSELARALERSKRP